MLTEDYCSYVVAKLLKEKGFDELCKYLYNDNGERYTLASTCYQNVCDEGECLCPTHQMAMKWLREMYDVHISVNKTFLINDIDNKPYLACVCTKKCHTSYNSWQEYHSTYEEAAEAALKYCLTELI